MMRVVLVAGALLACVGATTPPPPTHRRLPYPTAVCTPSNTTECHSHCPGRTCQPANDTAQACGVFIYPQLTRLNQKNNSKYCVPDFRMDCTEATQQGCHPCALWRVIQSRDECADGATDDVADDDPALRCVRHDYYAVMAAKEKEMEGRGKGLCLSQDHYLIMPTTPCKGLEVDACTGPPAERLWAASNATAAAKGFRADGDRRWIVMANAAHSRGQHQLHLHVGYMRTDRAKAIPLYLAQRGNFSTDAAKPTLLRATDGTEMATVFVKGRLESSADGRGGGVAPFAVAAEVAAKARPGIPYAIVVEPYTQPVGRRGAEPVAGVLVSAAWHFGDHEGLDSGETTVCSDACGPF